MRSPTPVNVQVALLKPCKGGGISKYLCFVVTLKSILISTMDLLRDFISIFFCDLRNVLFLETVFKLLLFSSEKSHY